MPEIVSQSSHGRGRRDRKGRVIEITDAQLSPKGKPVVVGAIGRVEVSKITRDATIRKIPFIDAAGKVISNPKPVLSAALKKSHAGLEGWRHCS